VAEEDADGVLLLLPDVDGPGRRARLDSLLAGRPAVVGLPAPWAAVAGEVPLLRRAAVLAAGMEGTVSVADELARLVVHADPVALGALRQRRLGQFAELSERSRERLLDTLASWLRNQGDRQEVARELAIHPQTVRYRVGQLRELLGDALDDPQSRFEFALALA
jgi:DNA-binding PucR family transcriptional regulator